MEILLWMWFYDPRFFFNFKLSIKCFKYIWLIPLIVNLLLAILCFYFLNYSDTPKCDTSLKLWLFSRAFFSLLISINIIVFMIKIYYVHRRENTYFENAIKIYSHLQETMKRYDYWIRRKSILSTPGVLLLLQGIMSMFWSYFIIRLHYFENKFIGCDDNMIGLINLNTFFIFVGNVPVLTVIVILIIIKLTSFISAFLCPKFLIMISKLCNTKSKGIKIYKRLDDIE